MKKYLSVLAVLSCTLLTGCMGVGISRIGNKMLEDRIEIDAAVLPAATAFYQNEESEYIEVPLQTFREYYPGASLVIGEVHELSMNKYYPLSPIQSKKVFLRRNKKGGENWFYWKVVDALPKNAVPMDKPQDWFAKSNSEKYMPRYCLVNVTERDNNSIWRKTGAVTCMILLDFPLTVAYSCSAFILALPALLIAP